MLESGKAEAIEVTRIQALIDDARRARALGRVDEAQKLEGIVVEHTTNPSRKSSELVLNIAYAIKGLVIGLGRDIEEHRLAGSPRVTDILTRLMPIDYSVHISSRGVMLFRLGITRRGSMYDFTPFQGTPPE